MNGLETSGMGHADRAVPCVDHQSTLVANIEAKPSAAVAEPIHSASPRTMEALSRVEAIMAGLGGVMVVHPNENGLVKFSVHFESSPALVERIEALLCSGVPDGEAGSSSEVQGYRSDEEIDRILQTTKQFMQAFCEGDLARCRDLLRRFADQQSQRELFVEIGQLAREFHTSLSDLTETLDPAFRILVEEKLPDSGSRLEHILEITERAANTTLDKVEAMQGRNEEDIKRIKRLGEILDVLKAIGPKAKAHLNEAATVTEHLASSAGLSRDDLVSILMAQDFQDLTGQIIQRVLTLLKDLETRLVNLVKVFGVREEQVEVEQDDLYGPAHKGKIDALHSQDDVDSLLADFGF